MSLFEDLTAKIEGKNIRIVFPEPTDGRVLRAAVRLSVDNLVEPVLIGSEEEIEKAATENGLDASDLESIDPQNYDAFEEMVEAFVERRKGKATKEEARKTLLDPNYFGTMLVYMDKVDGLVSGAINSTGDTVRPALQIIKTAEGVKRTSGAFLLVRNSERYIFADCAVTPEPDEENLAEIAIESAKTAELFDMDPKVALLSYSSKGSASSDQVDKVRRATEIANERNSGYDIDGELQFDTAFVSEVARKKVGDSPVAGQANVFVFPDLQSGNISYKIAQRLGAFKALGPILQGLNKPISDLSRGCVEEDVYQVSVVTALQALNTKKSK